MRPERLLDNINLYEWLESLLPDFVLAFAFFTSVVYSALGKRFEKQRPAIAMSAAIGIALSIGLVWWEQANNFSIKDIGPIAVGFAILLLAFVMYQCIRHVGGSWAGAGITIGASILIADLLGYDVPIDTEIIQTITVVALIIGLMALFAHRRNLYPHYRQSEPVIPDIKHTMADLYRERHLSKKLDHGLRTLRKEARTLNENPEEAANIANQIKRMLPAEGYLTERMAQLRAKAHQVKNGHIARLEETRHAFANLPTSAKKRASGELAARYNQIVGIDTRLERLDKEVAENEKRIQDLTRQAQTYANNHNHQKLYETLKAAEELQKHNSHLFKIIERTENKLSAIAKKVANEVKQIEK
jgi:hypothetical protein